MTNLITFLKSILHNKMKELFEIREELKKSGLTLFNRKVLNSSKNLENPSGSEFGFNEQPKPMMFVSQENYFYYSFIYLNSTQFFFLFSRLISRIEPKSRHLHSKDIS